MSPRGAAAGRAPRPALAPLLLVLLALATAGAPLRGAALALHQVSIDLPASPAAVVVTDLDHDGARDLLVLLVYTKWDQKVVEESTQVDGVQGMVAMMTIVPALLDHRELWWMRADGHGGYARAADPLPMPTSVHALLADDARGTVLALTDDGVDAVMLDANHALVLQPRLRAPSRLAGTGVFLPDLDLLADVDGDGKPELLFPASDGLRVYAVSGDGSFGEPLATLRLPRTGKAHPLRVSFPLPEVRDVDGDGRPDLVFRDPEEGWQKPWVARGEGGGRFTAPFAALPGEPEKTARRVARKDDAPKTPPPPDTVWFGDVDGDGRAEVVTQETQELPDDAGMRAEIHDAELPHSTLRVYPATLSASTPVAPTGAARQTFPVVGHVFDADGGEVKLPSGFIDLDHDGRRDLVTIELGISITRLLGGLALGHVSLPMSFHVWCQQADGGFAPVEGLDLSGTFRMELAGFQLRSLPSFAGDFDGDGRLDFVQLGHGKDVTIHTGHPGCRFPSKPDLEVTLRSEPEQLDLVQVRDLDGDHRSDLMVIVPGKAPEQGVTPPARLDLYLSGGSR